MISTLLLAATIVSGPNAAKIDDYMTRLERLGFSGALAVAKDDRVILEKAYGFRDAERTKPYTLDTAADIGSITKQFTAAAILALEEEGKLRTTDRMDRYLPGVPPDKTAITLHQLLTHSAGFPSEIGDDYEPIDRDAFIKRAMASKLLFAPGSGYAYSNVGYSLLGAIIEIVTGKPYERYLHDRLFVRAGMQHTGYVIPKWTELAHGVEDGRDWGTPLDHRWASDGPYWNLRANGGILSTPADMLRWSRALDGNRVLSAASRKKLFTPYVREGDAPSSYAYGWAVFPLPNGHTLIAHNGGNGVFAADFRRYVDDHLVLFIISNVSDKPSIAVSRFVGRLALGQDVAMPPKVVKLSSLPQIDGMRATETKDGGIALTPIDDAVFRRMLPPQDTRMSDASARTQAFGDRVLHGEGNEQQMELRRNLEKKLGPMKAATVLGTRSQRDLLVTTLRFDFEHGHVYVNVGWEGTGIAGVRVSDSLPSTEYFATTGGQLVHYDFRSGETTTVGQVDSAAGHDR